MIAVTQGGRESTNNPSTPPQRPTVWESDNFREFTEYLNNTCTQTAKKKVTIDCGREFCGAEDKGLYMYGADPVLMALEAA